MARSLRNINVAGRINKAVSTNVGGEGGSNAISTRQSVRIRQDPSGTHEEVETVEQRARRIDDPLADTGDHRTGEVK